MRFSQKEQSFLGRGQMKRAIPIKTLFLDIGGVLLTDGWDHNARKRAATSFKLEWAETENRHRSPLNTRTVIPVRGSIADKRWGIIGERTRMGVLMPIATFITKRRNCERNCAKASR
jgi:hypothetical protein